MNSRTRLILLALGGLAFNAGGMTHPGDSGHGNKIDQLHEMLVQSTWYPSHLLLLTSMVCFALGLPALADGRPPTFRRLVRCVSVVAVVAVAGMTVHTLEALNAANLADGHGNLFSSLQVVNETLVDAGFAVAVGTLAVVGGLTRRAGNAITAGIGLVGAAAFGLASATIAFTDRFDFLFPLGGLLGLWAVVVGLWYAVAPYGGRVRSASSQPAVGRP
jgi:hypothetical protein